MSVEELSPAVDPERTRWDAPVAEVTVLEDRAEVTRRGTVTVSEGVNRLALVGVAPILQDVSLQVRPSAGQLSLARVVRAWRVRRDDRPADVADLEAELREGADAVQALEQRMDRATSRLERLHAMLGAAAAEVPDDAAWGRVDPAAWRTSFGTLFERARAERRALVEAWLDATETVDDLAALRRRLRQRLRPDVELAAVAEIDLVVQEAGEVQLELSYVVPNALWRPLHRAALQGEQLAWTRRAAIWQHTGEDWSAALLRLSTARSGLGTEPPTLRDDLLTVQRRSEEVSLQARDVAVQTTGPVGGGGPDTGRVDLPGVDDGGEVQHLVVPDPITVPSDTDPVLVDLGTAVGAATVEHICLPEALERVVVKVTGPNDTTEPLLPGPVELLRGGGPYGWAEVAFTAPGAYFELSFGPDDDLRVQREAEVLRTRRHHADKKTRRRMRVRVHLSNVGTDDRVVQLTERIPVSEVEELAIEGVEATPPATPDSDGFLRWSVAMAPADHRTVELRYTLVAMPGIELPD